MHDQHSSSFSGPASPIEQVRLLSLRPGLAEALRPLLQVHGASLEVQADGDGCIVRFPPGTTRRRKFPFVYTERAYITLPDGYTILYEQDRAGRNNLYFDPRDLPAEVVAEFE